MYTQWIIYKQINYILLYNYILGLFIQCINEHLINYVTEIIKFPLFSFIDPTWPFGRNCQNDNVMNFGGLERWWASHLVNNHINLSNLAILKWKPLLRRQCNCWWWCCGYGGGKYLFLLFKSWINSRHHHYHNLISDD